MLASMDEIKKDKMNKIFPKIDFDLNATEQKNNIFGTIKDIINGLEETTN